MQYPDVDVIWESEDGAERIVLAYEEGPSAPCNDGGTPILAIYPWGEVGQITEITSYVVDDDIISALRRCHELHDGQDLFERYLRIFHGATSVEWYVNGNFYVTFDTADWRNEMGLTDERMADYAEFFEGKSIASMDEWVSYCEGEVYWARLEAKGTWSRQDFRADGTVTETVGELWDTVDTVGGFYGYEWAVEGAKEHLIPLALANEA